jgi:hypothetical protein
MVPKGPPARTDKAGKILVGVGLALAAMGGVLLAYGVSDGASNNEAPIYITFGGSMVVLGGVTTLVGIPLWVAYAVRAK